MKLILTSKEDSIATITLNNHRKLNALSRALIDEIIQALREFRKDEIRVVILRAPEGSRI